MTKPFCHSKIYDTKRFKESGIISLRLVCHQGADFQKQPFTDVLKIGVLKSKVMQIQMTLINDRLCV